MRRRVKGLKKSLFVKNVIVMATGTAGAQAVTMFFSPIITRLFGPEAFGILGTFNSFVNIIIPIAALTYPIAIILPKKDNESFGIIKLSIIITFIVSIISLIVLMFFNKNIVKIFNIDEISDFIYFIPLVILFAGIMQVTNQWLIRKQQFKINAKVNLMQSIIINGSKAGIGLFYPTAAVLVILQVISNGLKAFMMIFLLNWSSNIKIKNIKFNNNISIKSLAKKYIDFPLLRAPEVFLSSFSQNLPVLLLTSLFGPASAGFYSIGRTVLSLPSSLIGNAVGDVFYPHITKAANKREDLNYIIRKATITLFGVGLIPFGTIILFGPILFKLVFGAEWGTAGEYARWIALFSFSIFINKPSVKSFPVLKAQGIHLIFTITILIVQSIALLVGFFVFKDDKVAVAFFGTSGMILNILLIFVTLKMANKFNENNYR